LPRWLERSTLAVAHLRLAPTSSASSSVTDRLSPSGVSQLRWRFVYRAIDQFGQVIDVFVSTRRDSRAARRFFERAIDTTKTRPVEVVTDRAPTYPLVVEELVPAAWHRTDRYANNCVEANHGRLKARL
jgi:transposase-like protein